MRAALVLKLLAAAALLAALGFGAAAYRSFRSALAARLERAASIEAAAARPAAAARLAAALAERRLALVTEKESRAVSAAFRRGFGGEALEAYRRARGEASVLHEAEKALAAQGTPDPEGDIPFLRAVRALRAETARMPSLTPPVPPASAREARGRLLWAAAALLAGGSLSYAAGRAG